MKSTMKTTFVFLALFFSITQCSKDNPVAPDNQSEPDSEIMAITSEIDELDVIVLSDSNDGNKKRHLRKALIKLDHLLDKTRIIIRKHDDEEVKTLYHNARVAQQSAIDAAKMDNFEVAFDYIQESRHFAIEAIKLVKEDIHEKRQEIIERLKELTDNIKDLLDEVKILLDGAVEPDPRAVKLFKRARYHFRSGVEALRDHDLRKAGFHLRRSKKYATITLRILNEDED